MPQPSRRRSLIIAAAAGAFATLALALLVGPLFLLTHRDDAPFERAYAAAMLSIVVRVAAGDAPNPVANDARALEIGRIAYTGSCSFCHGASGDGRGSFGPSTYPDAADLTAPQVATKTDAQLFWITKNGLGFTAMPAFKDAFRDEDIWALVTYMRALQRGSGRTIDVPAPARAHLSEADPSADRVARGAAIFYAQGCYRCHGPEANAPGELAIRGRIDMSAVRSGQRGMPKFGPDRITDAELADLELFLLRFAVSDSGVLARDR